MIFFIFTFDFYILASEFGGDCTRPKVDYHADPKVKQAEGNNLFQYEALGILFHQQVMVNS